MSVPSFLDVRLEIVRPGKPHNQLLSPLTPYMALCGEGSPITFYIDLEHQQLLTRLERLRYVTRVEQRVQAIPQRLREGELDELGGEIARILSDIRTLSTELARAQSPCSAGAKDTIIHLRLVLAGSELALIPFELAVSPLGYPGEGLEFCLQTSLPIVVTREIRRSERRPVSWARSSRTAPKVLFVYAEPDGLRVPAEAHLGAIRAALEPWIRRVPARKRANDPEKDERRRLSFVKDRVRIVPNASIEKIYEACAREEFTHVHVLAHGDTYEYAGETRFGVALCSDADGARKEVVSGKRLAKALQAEGARGSGRSSPLVVTLATCDSGNQKTVLVPGGSIAHDLYSEGIPWVLASQFPLTIPGSVRMAKILYPRLFRGDDPRQALFELRRQLFQSAQGDHDWASLVAYASLPRDFAEQVEEFGSRQIKEAIKVSLEYADSVVQANGTGAEARRQQDEIERSTREVEEWLRTWRERMPTGGAFEEHMKRAEIVGMHGSTYKRIALLHVAIKSPNAEVDRYYRKSLESYRDSMAEAAATNLSYYWSASQYLSLRARGKLEKDKKTYELAWNLAERDAANAALDPGTRAWARATLAELVLLAAYHTVRPENAADQVREHCAEIVRLMGPKSWHVGSTLLQFKRYHDHWKNELWAGIPEAALDEFEKGGAVPGDFAFPDD